jgi:hypothetical protein
VTRGKQEPALEWRCTGNYLWDLAINNVWICRVYVPTDSQSALAEFMKRLGKFIIGEMSRG